MRLNRHKPYGLVAGLPGVAFQQDGHYFNGDGHWVADPEAPEPEVPTILGPDGQPAQREAEQAESNHSAVGTSGAPGEVPIPDPPPLAKSDDMRLKENKALKVQMEAYGEEWQGVAHARKFLGVT